MTGKWVKGKIYNPKKQVLGASISHEKWGGVEMAEDYEDDYEDDFDDDE